MINEIISSAKNPTIKHLRKLLSNNKYRLTEQVAIAEGIHLIESLLSSDLVIEAIILSQSALLNPEIKKLLANPKAREFQKTIIKDSLFDSLSDVDSKVGVLAVFYPEAKPTPKPLANDALLLDNIQDPGNLGTILRTAAAAGVNDIYLSAGSASVYSPKSLRAGMGAQFSLNIYENVDLVALAASSSVPVLATALDDSQNIYEVDLKRQIAWAFGNEGQGVSAELLAICKQRVRIPQTKASVESLNVSAAAAICLYEQYRQKTYL